MELGVDSDPRFVDKDLDKFLQSPLVGDQSILDRRLPAQDPSPFRAPDSVGKSAATHALVPPATLTASMPWERRNSVAVRLRPPIAQIT
jgi:hypothetical protein